MTVVSVMSAKGGSGASLIATNLAVALAHREKTLLVDLHPGTGYDDVLLDVTADRSWADLLPVAAELHQRQLALAEATHPSGLRLLSAPPESTSMPDEPHLRQLLQALAKEFVWLVLDPPAGPADATRLSGEISDAVLLITTADPGSLRAVRRLFGTMPVETQTKSGLIVNQIGSRHPADPSAIAESIGAPLLAVLPPDPRAVGYQVNFGQVCALDDRSPFGRAVVRLGDRMIRAAAARAMFPSTGTVFEVTL